MDPIVHFEIPVTDLERAKAFYGPIFGWKLEDYPMPEGMNKYVGVHTTAIDGKTHQPLKPGAINGGIMIRTDVAKAPILAVNVPSIDERIKQIEAAGGKY